MVLQDAGMIIYQCAHLWNHSMDHLHIIHQREVGNRYLKDEDNLFDCGQHSHVLILWCDLGRQ